MVAPVFVAAATAFAPTTTATNENAVTVPRPSGVVTGDLLVASVQVSGTATGIATPAGWVLLAGGYSALFVKFVTATDPTTGYSFRESVAGGGAMLATISAWRNVDNVIPIAGDSGAQGLTCPAVSGTSFADGHVVRILSGRENLAGISQSASVAGHVVRARDAGQSAYLQSAHANAAQTSTNTPAAAWTVGNGTGAGIGPSMSFTIVLTRSNVAPTAPAAFTSPAAGERFTTTGLVSHGGSFDPDADPLTYDFDLSTDNGATWVAKRVKLAGASFTHDYSALAATNTAQWRSRAWDGRAYGNYQTSAAFQINRAPSAPAVTAPVGGENYATSMTVTWAAATDPNFDVLSYEVEFSSDGGATWSVLATGVSLTSYTHNAAALPATQAARVRVRANDGLLPGPYSTSAANFTINRAPTAPTLGVPDNTVANLRGGYTFPWTHNDVDLQEQALYAFMRTRGTTTQWWDGAAWVTTEFYVSSAAMSVAFLAGFWPSGLYTWTVSTADIFGTKSAYAVARRITSIGGLSMVV